MLSFRNLACRRDAEVLFSDVNQVIYRAQKVGVTGANGCGKSSLLQMILGQLDPDDGEVELQNGVEVAHVAQETVSSDASALDFVMDGDRRLRDIEKELAAAGDDGNLTANLLAEYDAIGGYTAQSRAGTLLYGLGFSAEQHHFPVARFSGGWRMRLNLAQALMCRSDLLLLDEPTNHLDLDAVLWLENWLQVYTGTLLLISHDREFLDRTVGHIFNIEQRSARLYTGDYSAFEAARAERLAGEHAAYEKQQRRMAEIQGFVDRFRAKATKARQAQSRLKMLERMTVIAPAHVDSAFRFAFHVPERQPNPLVALDRATVGYAQTPILDGVRLNLQPGDRIALLGINGAGKSTLLKTLVGELDALAGERFVSPYLKMGYFAQHQVDQLRYDQSALDHLLALDASLSESTGRDVLGGFGFHGDQALQVCGTMSGGEKARLALALIVHQRPNLLLLDEPTNHLDLNMRQALCEALQTFEGALVVISHDRFLLRSVADELWLVADGSVQPFTDDLDGYARWLSKRRTESVADLAVSGADTGSADRVTPPQEQSASSAHSATDRKSRKRQDAAQRNRLQPLKRAAQQLELKNTQLCDELESVRAQLGDNHLYSSEAKETLADLLRQEASLAAAVVQSEEEWLEALDALETASQSQGSDH